MLSQFEPKINSQEDEIQRQIAEILDRTQISVHYLDFPNMKSLKTAQQQVESAAISLTGKIDKEATQWHMNLLFNPGTLEKYASKTVDHVLDKLLGPSSTEDYLLNPVTVYKFE